MDPCSILADWMAEYGRELYAFARRHLGDHGRAEDAVQETFLRACSRLRAGDEVLQPRAFLYAILRRVICEMNRVRRTCYDRLLARATERLPTPEAVAAVRVALHRCHSTATSGTAAGSGFTRLRERPTAARLCGWAQETLLELLAQIGAAPPPDRNDPTDSELDALAAAVGLSGATVRRELRPTRLDPPQPVPVSGPTAEQAESCIEGLPEPQRTVCRLHYLERCSQQQIADRLGMPYGTVGSHLYHARQALVECLREYQI